MKLASYDIANCDGAPAIGTFRGNAVTAGLTAAIDIRAVNDKAMAAPVAPMLGASS